MRSHAILGSLATALLLATPALAGDPSSLITPYDKTFTAGDRREKGDKGDKEENDDAKTTDRFTAPTDKGTWYVTVEAPRKVSAKVALNGKRIFGEGDLEREDRGTVLRKTVTVKAQNELTVSDVEGLAGSKVRIHVDGFVPDAAIPAAMRRPAFERTFFERRFAHGKTQVAFAVPDTIGLFWLDVENGTSDKKDPDRAAEASITLNGERLFDKDDFERLRKGSVPALALPANTLAVDVGEPRDATILCRFRGIVVDTLKLSIDQPKDGVFTSLAGNLVISYSDTSGGVDTASLKVTVNGTDVTSRLAVGAGSATAALAALAPPLADGTNAVVATVSNKSGQQAQATIKLLLDSTAPAISVAPSGGYTNASPTATVNFSDAGSGVNAASLKILLDGADVTASFTVTASGATAKLAGLTDGVHTLAAAVADNVGNVGQASSSFTVDARAPLISVAPSGGFTNATPTATVSFSDPQPGSGLNAASFKAALDGTDITASFAMSANGATAKLGPLAAGAHTLTVSIADNVGNASAATGSFTADTTAPTISVAPNGGFTSATANVTVSFSKAGGSGLNTASFKASLDGADVTASFTATATGATAKLAGLASGSHTVVASIADNVGNGASASGTFTADTTPPTVSVTPNGVFTNATANVSVSFSDAGSGVDTTTFKAALDGADATASFTVTATGATAKLGPLAGGPHSVTVTIADKVGNAGSGTGSFIADVTPPTIAVSPSSGFTNGSPSFTVTYSDAGSGLFMTSFTAKLDGADVTGRFVTGVAGATGTVGPLADGAHTLVVSITDNVGNASSATASFASDGTPPTVSVTPNSGFTGGTANVSVSFSDAGSGVNTTTFKATLDGADVTASFTVTATGATATLKVTGGAHSVVATIADKVGNSASVTGSFTADVTPSTLTVTPSGGFTNAHPTATVTYSDTGSGVNTASFKATLDSVDVTAKFTVGAASATAALGPLADGAHTLVVTAADNVGNASSATSSFTSDGTPPTVSVTPNSGFTGGTANVSVSFSDAGSGVNTTTFKATLDGADVTASFTVTATGATAALKVAGGAHSVVATIADKVGNSASATGSFTADVTPPTLTVTPSGGFTSPNPSVTVAYADPLPGSGVDTTTLKATLDGADVTARFTVGASSASATLGPLADGAHSLVVTLADKVGNSASATVTLTADGTPPTVSLTPNGGFTNGSPSATATYSDAGSGVDITTFKATLDGADVTVRFTVGAGSATASLGPLASGLHTLNVTIADKVGNSATATRTFTVDATPPTLTVTPNGGFTRSTVALTAAYSDAGSGINTTTFNATLDGAPFAFAVGATSATATATGLADGAHTLVVTISDNVGNSTSATATFNVDARPPVVTISSTGGASPTVTVNYSDPVPGSGLNTASFHATLDVADISSSFAVGAASATATLTIAAGNHTLIVTIADNVGNTGQGSATLSGTVVDSPTIAVGVTPAGAFTTSNPTINVTYSDPGVGLNTTTFRAVLDGNDVSAKFTVTAGSATWSVVGAGVGLGDGSHTVAVAITSNGGTTARASLTFSVDARPPIVNVQSTGGTNPTITATYQDPTPGSGINPGSISASLDGTNVSAAFTADATHATATLTVTGTGPHTLTFFISDLVGNSTGVSIDPTKTGDQIPPTMTLDPFPHYVTTSITLTVRYVDLGSGINQASFQALLDGVNVTSSFVAGPASATGTVALTPNSHIVVFKIADNAGNTSTMSTGTFVSDQTPPTQTVSIVYSGTTANVTDALFDGQSGVNASTFRATLDGGNVTSSFTVTASQATGSFPGLALGGHTLVTSVGDNVGNVGTLTTSFNVVIDTTPPIISNLTISPFTNGFTTSAPFMNVTVSDPETGINQSTFHVTLDGVDVTSKFGPSGATFSGLVDGAHVVVVSVADNAGNFASRTFNFSSDGTPPTVTVSPSGGTLATHSPLFVVTVSDSGSGVNATQPGALTATLDGVPVAGTGFATTGGTFQPNVTSGSHRLDVFARDIIGNTRTVTVVFTVALPAARFDVSIAPGDPTALAVGSQNELQLVARDAAGQIAPSFTGTVAIAVSDRSAPLDGLLVPFLASNNGQVTVPAVATFPNIGNVTVTATALGSPSVTGSLLVTVIPAVVISPEPLVAYVGQRGTTLYSVSIVPSSATTTLLIGGTFATFGGGAISLNLSNGGTFTLDGIALGNDSLTANVSGVPAIVNNTFALQLPVTVSPALSGTFLLSANPEPEQNPAGAAAGVYLSNGQTHVERVDLSVPGRGEVSFVFARTYKSFVQNTGIQGSLGVGWVHNYEMRLKRTDAQTILWYTGTGRAEAFVQQLDGSYASPTGFFCRLLGTDTGFTIREPDGMRYVFNSLADLVAPGALAAVRDRHGNRLAFQYAPSGNGVGRISQVRDAYDRLYTYTYDATGHLQSVQDLSGRTVSFKYSAAGDLVKVTGPAITATTQGGALIPENTFANGKSEIYAYTSGNGDARLNHKMLLVVAPNEAAGVPDASLGDLTFLTPLARVQNTWTTDPLSANYLKLASQRVGGTNASGSAAGGNFSIAYTPVAPAGTDPINDEILDATVTDRNGNTSDLFLNATGQCVRIRQNANRNVRPRGSGPGQDPAFFETFLRYNQDGLRVLVQKPLGGQIVSSYQGSVNRNSQANLISRTVFPDGRGDSRGGVAPRTTTYAYEPIYNMLRRFTEERGNDSSWTAGLPTTSYTWTNFFDYQQTATIAALSSEVGLDQTTTSNLLGTSGVLLARGDLNNNPSDDAFMAGDVVKTVAPTATTPTPQTIVTLTVHNVYGQPVIVTDPEQNVHTFSYYPSNDPDGGAALVPGSTQTDPSGGYVHTTVVDAQSDPRREQNQNPTPTQLTTTLFYDPIGNVVGMLDRRGIRHSFDVNALGQTVHAKLATDVSQAYLPRDRQLAPLNYERHVIFDANNNVIETRIGNQGERDGTSAFVATNPWWSTKRIHDMLDHVVKTIQEVTPIANDSTITETSPGVLVTRISYDANENPILVMKPEGNAVATAYDERDLVFTVTRGFGSTLASTSTRHYDLNGNLQYVVSAVKNQPTKSAFFPQGDVTTFNYDGFDRRMGVVDAELNRTDSVLDPASHVARVVRYGPPEEGSPRLAERAALYDEDGRLTRTRDYVFTYVPASTGAAFLRTNPATETQPAVSGEAFAVSTFSRDALGRTVTASYPDGEQYDTKYDGAGRPIDELGPILAQGPTGNVRNERQHAYDGAGNPILETQIDVGSSTQTFVNDNVYDAAGRRIRVSDTMNFTTRFYYDSRSNLIDTTDARSSATVVDPLSLRGTGPITINGDGNVTRRFYDGVSRPIRVERLLKIGGVGDGDPNLTTNTNLDLTNPATPTGIVVTLTGFDQNGRIKTQTDPNNNVTSRNWDALDRLTGELFADGTTSATVYDLDDNAIQTTDPNGSVIKTGHDGLGRPTVKNVTVRAQNLAGTGQNVIGTTLQAFEWDGLSRLRAAIDDNGAAASLGVATFLTFDSLSHKTAEREVINASVSVNAVSTTNGRINVQGAGTTIDRTVTLGYTTLSTPPLFTNVPTSIGYPTGPNSQTTLHFAVDNQQRWSSISDFDTPLAPPGSGGKNLVDYAFLGNRVATRAIDPPTVNLTTTISYCPCGCPNTLTATSSQVTGPTSSLPAILGIQFTFNQKYNLITRNIFTLDPNPVRNLGYSSLDELTTSGPSGAALTQVKDGAGNDVTAGRPNGTTAKYNTNAAGTYVPDVTNRNNKIDVFSGATLLSTDNPVHDADGARIKDRGRKLLCDAFGRLVEVDVSFNGGVSYVTAGQYTYDASGRRATKRASVYDSSGTLVRTDNLAFISNGPQEIEDVDLNSGAIVATYVWGQDIDELCVLQNAAGRFAVFGDFQQTNYLAVNMATGLPAERYTYTNEYGSHKVMTPGSILPNTVGTVKTLAQEIHCPFRFQGRRFDDESGLYYFRNRYLDPVEGRFVSRDPIGMWGDASARGNGYTFEGGNPASRRDPFGLDDVSVAFSGQALLDFLQTGGGLISASTVDSLADALRSALPAIAGQPTSAEGAQIGSALGSATSSGAKSLANDVLAPPSVPLINVPARAEQASDAAKNGNNYQATSLALTNSNDIVTTTIVAVGVVGELEPCANQEVLEVRRDAPTEVGSETVPPNAPASGNTSTIEKPVTQAPPPGEPMLPRPADAATGQPLTADQMAKWAADEAATRGTRERAPASPTNLKAMAHKPGRGHRRKSDPIASRKFSRKAARSRLETWKEWWEKNEKWNALTPEQRNLLGPGAAPGPAPFSSPPEGWTPPPPAGPFGR